MENFAASLGSVMTSNSACRMPDIEAMCGLLRASYFSRSDASSSAASAVGAFNCHMMHEQGLFSEIIIRMLCTYPPPP